MESGKMVIAKSQTTHRKAKMAVDPRGVGVSSQLPSAEGGGVHISPLSNLRTNRRSEKREAAIESSQEGILM